MRAECNPVTPVNLRAAVSVEDPLESVRGATPGGRSSTARSLRHNLFERILMTRFVLCVCRSVVLAAALATCAAADVVVPSSAFSAGANNAEFTRT